MPVIPFPSVGVFNSVTFIYTSRGTRWGEIISVSDLELYEI